MIEHELKARIIDRVKQKSDNFSDLLIEITKEPAPQCDLTDIHNFCDEYVSKVNFVFPVLIDANRYCNISSQVPNDSWLAKLNACSLFHLNKIDLETALKQADGDFFKLLLLSMSINRVIGCEGTIICKPILSLHNSWKHYDLSPLINQYDSLKSTIFGDNKEIPALTFIESNIKRLAVGPRKDWVSSLFEKKNGLNILHNYALKSGCVSYEEDLLYQYSQLRYENKEFLEMMNFGTPWPDVNSISEDDLNETKAYFGDNRVDFLVNLIRHTLFKSAFSNDDEMNLVSIMKEFLAKPCRPVPEIIHYLFDNFSSFSKATKGTIAKASKTFTDSIDDVDLIYKYWRIGFLLGKTSNAKLNTLYEHRKKQLLKSNNSSEFLQRLSDECAVLGIAETDLTPLHKLFDRFTNGGSGLEASIYVTYEKTLREKLLPREDISNEKVRGMMLFAMWKWQKTGFKKASSLLTKFESKRIEVPEKVVEESNKEIVGDPMNYFFRSDMSFYEERIIDSFIATSDSLTFLITGHISLRPDFPRSTSIDDLSDEEARLLFKSGTVQKVLFEYFKRIRDENAYKLLNPFHTYSFYKMFLDRIQLTLPISLSFWFGDKELYNKLKKDRPKASLSRFKKTKDYGMVTQLFPLLEDEIVKYSASKGIIPLEFTNDTNFAHRIQPHVLLAKLIVKASDFYNGNVGMVGDLIWIYLIMYSEDGMNIRNNVIHGVDYPFGKGTIQLQFSLTLLCVAEMVRRNQMVKNGEDGLFSDE